MRVTAVLVIAAITSWWASMPSHAATDPAMAGQPPLMVVSLGGVLEKSQMLAYVHPYRQVRLRWVNVEDYAGGLTEIRSQVAALNVKWDVVSMHLSNAIRACDQGLLEVIDPALLPSAPDGTPARDDFFAGALQTCAVGQAIWSTVVAYNAGRFAVSPPTRLNDFFNTKKFPGERGLRRSPKGNLEWALMADGVPPTEVYRELSTAAGLDRAFDMLEQIKPNIVWWTKASEPAQLLARNMVVMSSAGNGRIFAATTKGNEQLSILWDGQILDMVVWVIPKGSNRLEQALDFVVFASDPKRLAAQAEITAYGPPRRSTLALLSEDVKQHLPNVRKARGSALQFDSRWWAQHYPHIQERFDDWIEQPANGYNFRASDGN